MFGLFFHFGIILVFPIPATSSDEFLVKTDVGSTDKVSFPNLSCQMTSERKICQSFGARGVVHNGSNCSCSCPQNANTFGFDDDTCKCLPKNISYEGCPKFSQITSIVLQRNSSTKLFLPDKNCSLAVLERQNNGSWITVNNFAETIRFTMSGELNGSFVYVLQVTNSAEDFQGTLYNVIVQCPKQNSTCYLLKLSSTMKCPFILPSTSTHAPTKPTTNLTVQTTPKNNSSGLSEGEIAAIVVSCIVVLAIILLVLLLLWIRRRRQHIKDKRRPSRQQLDPDDERRSSEPHPVVFSLPNRPSTQRKDSENLGFEPDGGITSDDNDEEPNYDSPIDEKHSVISDFINKIKRPLSMKTQTPNTVNKKEEKPDNEDEYQVMENTVIYENTRNEIVGENEPTRKKTWKDKMKRKDKKSGNQGSRNEGKSKNREIPQVPKEEEVAKNKGGESIELENLYENDEAIRNNKQHKDPSGTRNHEHRASYSNDVPAENDEEEGPPPPPRTTSLEKMLDKPDNQRPIPSPRMKNKLSNKQGNDEFSYDNDNSIEDPSELYENTRKSSYPMPTPRAKR